jgi:hypothetical protein
MSSLLDQDFSCQLSPYAPKWVREAAHTERPSMASKVPEWLTSGSAQEINATLARSDAHPAINGYRVPRSLEPTLMPDPYPVSAVRSALGVLARFAFAVAIIAIIFAIFVAGKISGPWAVSAKEQKEDISLMESRLPPKNARPANQPEQPVPELSVDQQGPRTSGEVFPLGASVPLQGAGGNLEWSRALPRRSSTDLKDVFEQFVEDYTASTGQTTFSAREKEVLFAKFQQFLDAQTISKSTR